MGLHWIDICILAIYMLALLAMGFYFSKKNTNTEEYFVGGRSYSGWVIGLSLIGTSISSISFMGYPGDAFKASWIRFLGAFALPPALFIAAYFFIPLYRRRHTTTAYEFLEERYGPSVRTYGAVAFLLGQILRISIILYMVALLMEKITGLDPVLCAIIAGIIVAVYTILGGIDAVIWTDVIQTIVLLGGGIVALIAIIYKLPGGLSQIIDVATEHGKISFSELIDDKLVNIKWDLSLARKTGSMFLFMGFIYWLTEYGTNQAVVQRYAAAKSTKEARKALWVTASSLLIWAFFMFLGTSLYVFYQVFPATEAAEMLSGVEKAEGILPFFIMDQLPVGVVGVVLAAALAAAMSSIDTSLNSISTVGVHDIYRRHIVKSREDKHYLKVAWVMSSVAAVLMIVGAIILTQTKTKTLMDTMSKISGSVAAGIFAIYMFGFLTKIKNLYIIWSAILVTFLFTLWTYLAATECLPDALTTPFDLYYTGFIGNVLLFSTAMLGLLIVRTWRRYRRNSLTNGDSV